jgi:hypothetical protein
MLLGSSDVATHEADGELVGVSLRLVVVETLGSALGLRLVVGTVVPLRLVVVETLGSALVLRLVVGAVVVVVETMGLRLVVGVAETLGSALGLGLRLVVGVVVVVPLRLVVGAIVVVVVSLRLVVGVVVVVVVPLRLVVGVVVVETLGSALGLRLVVGVVVPLRLVVGAVVAVELLLLVDSATHVPDTGLHVAFCGLQHVQKSPGSQQHVRPLIQLRTASSHSSAVAMTTAPSSNNSDVFNDGIVTANKSRRVGGQYNEHAFF